MNLESGEGRIPENLLIRIRPGNPTDLEEKIVGRWKRIAPGWSFELQFFEKKRDFAIKLTLAPVVGLALIAAFLLLMVGLGLTGVLWLNVTERIGEIGLRRSFGASSLRICGQIVTEMVMVATVPLIVGSLLVLRYTSISGG